MACSNSWEVKNCVVVIPKSNFQLKLHFHRRLLGYLGGCINVPTELCVKTQQDVCALGCVLLIEVCICMMGYPLH